MKAAGTDSSHAVYPSGVASSPSGTAVRAEVTYASDRAGAVASRHPYSRVIDYFGVQHVPAC